MSYRQQISQCLYYSQEQKCASNTMERETDREEKRGNFSINCLILSSPLLCSYFLLLLCFTHFWRVVYFQWHKMTTIYLQGAKGSVVQYQRLNDLGAEIEAGRDCCVLEHLYILLKSILLVQIQLSVQSKTTARVYTSPHSAHTRYFRRHLR